MSVATINRLATGKVAADNLSFANETSKATGKDERTIRRAAARGEALGDDLAAIAGTSLARRKDAYEALHPETKPTSEGGGGRNNATRRQLGDDIAARFTADTAAKTGQSERAVQRDAERGDFGVMAESENLPPAGGFKLAANAGGWQTPFRDPPRSPLALARAGGCDGRGRLDR